MSKHDGLQCYHASTTNAASEIISAIHIVGKYSQVKRFRCKLQTTVASHRAHDLLDSFGAEGRQDQSTSELTDVRQLSPVVPCSRQTFTVARFMQALNNGGKPPCPQPVNSSGAQGRQDQSTSEFTDVRQSPVDHILDQVSQLLYSLAPS